jgi:hypothetical protein
MKFSARKIEWFITLHGRQIPFVFIQTVWSRGDLDFAVVGFILN